MAATSYDKLSKQEQREMMKKFRNPPTKEYQKWRKIWWGFAVAALVFAAMAFPQICPLGPDNIMVFVVLGNAMVVAVILLETVKLHRIRVDYIDSQVCKQSKSARAEEKARNRLRREMAKEAAARPIKTLAEVEDDPNASYWDKLKARAHASAQAATIDPKELRKMEKERKAAEKAEKEKAAQKAKSSEEDSSDK